MALEQARAPEAKAIIERKRAAYNIQAKVMLGINNGKVRIYDADYNNPHKLEESLSE